MSRFFKSAAFPILIVIVLAFFASKLISRSDQAEKTYLRPVPPSRSTAGRSVDVNLRTKDQTRSRSRSTRPDKNKYQVGYPA